MITKTGARQQTLRYQYYSWGPVQSEQHFAAGATAASRQLDFTYDNNANLASVTDDGIQVGVATSHAYDVLNRPTSNTVHYIPSGDKVISASYDRFGNRSGAGLDDGVLSSSAFAYNKRNHLSQAMLPSNRQYAFEYFRNSDMKSITYPSGATRDYTYKANGPVQDIQLKAANDSAIEQWQYSYDSVLNISSLTDSLGARTYDYDGLDHLTQADYPANSGLADENYDYDKVGNRAEPGDVDAYQYDANHRLVEVNGVTLGYDVDGNLTSKSDGAALSYDLLNRLDQYTNGSSSASYLYNATNQRIRKTANGVTTWYLYDGGNLVAEYDNTGTRLKRYDYLPFGYAPAQINENASTYEVQVDHLDTPRLLVDQNQNVVWRSNHQAFGDTQPDEDVDGDGISITFNMRFPGQYYDQETGLHYNWNRYYDPTIGRYVTSDPIGILPGLYRWNHRSVPRHIKYYFAGMRTNNILIEGLNHIYGYVSANPLAYTDISGLAAECRYYDARCGEDGGPYYCEIAPRLCGGWPPAARPPFGGKDWVGCVRRCLQRKDYQCDLTPGQCSDEGIDVICNVRIHRECWIECY